MNKIVNKIINILIVLLVIGLYILVFNFIYNSFRERKRNEMAKEIVDKVKEEIDKTDEHNTIEEVKVKQNNHNFTVLGIIKIKKINIKEPILKENTKKAYDVSVVKMNSIKLNSYGNVAIGGHNYMKGNFFIKINRLKKGDKVEITDLDNNTINYYVYDYGTASINDSSYLSQPIDSKSREVTLVTCTDGGKKRYYVKAKAK